MNWGKIRSGLRYTLDVSPGLAYITLLSSKSTNTSPLKATKKETSHSSWMGRIVWNRANVNQNIHSHLISKRKWGKDCTTHPRLVFKAMTCCFGKPAVNTIAGNTGHPPGRRKQQTVPLSLTYPNPHIAHWGKYRVGNLTYPLTAALPQREGVSMVVTRKKSSRGGTTGLTLP